MVISEDPWHSHLMRSVWQWSFTTCLTTSVCRGWDSNTQPYACGANALIHCRSTGFRTGGTLMRQKWRIFFNISDGYINPDGCVWIMDSESCYFHVSWKNINVYYVPLSCLKYQDSKTMYHINTTETSYNVTVFNHVFYSNEKEKPSFYGACIWHKNGCCRQEQFMQDTESAMYRLWPWRKKKCAIQ